MAKKKLKLKSGKRIVNEFKEFLVKKSQNAQKATRILVIVMLFGIITGMIGVYLYHPAKEIFYSERQYIEETRNIFDYKVDSQERVAQQEKANQALEVYSSVMDKYTQDTNFLISGYANLHSNFIKTIIAILVVLPFLAIFLMFIGGPINFIFALINIFIVAPIKVAVYLFRSFREKETKETKSTTIPTLQETEA